MTKNNVLIRTGFITGILHLKSPEAIHSMLLPIHIILEI